MIFAGYVTYLTGMPFWVDRVYTLYRHCRGAFTTDEYYLQVPASAGPRVRREARTYVSMYMMLLALGIVFSSSLGACFVRLIV